MNRSRGLFLLVSLAVLVPVMTTVLWSAGRRSTDGDVDSPYKNLAIFSEVLNLIRSNYVDPTDSGQLMAGAFDGMGDALDPFSTWVPVDQLAVADAANAVGRSRSGLTLLKDQGIAFVLAVEAGSPAAQAGLQAGDIVAEIDGRSTREMPAWALEAQLAGSVGTTLKLRVLRQGDDLKLDLPLADYQPPAPEVVEHEGLPMLRIGSFGPETVAQARALVEGLAAREATQLLVDLRGVAGGSPAAAFGLAALFADGELGQLAGRSDEPRRFNGESAPLWRGEIVVLVDASSQGPAEILAAVLRARAGARLVGVETFGWAGEVEPVELSDGSRLRLTTAFYAPAGGAPISTGLAPDLLVDDFPSHFGDREKPLADRILERGVGLLRGSDAERQAA